MELKKFIFCAYLLFLIFPMSIKGQESTSNNYIIVKYSDEVKNAKYANGFSIDNIPSRKGVNYIIKGNSRYKSNEFLSIGPGDSIEIHFNNEITSLEKFFNIIDDRICEYIIYVDLSHFNSSLVVNTREMFLGCQRIQKLIFTNFNTSSVTNMESMFFECWYLESLDISKFNTSSVTNMESMFDCCHSLKSLDVSKFNTSSVTNMESMFDS